MREISYTLPAAAMTLSQSSDTTKGLASPFEGLRALVDRLHLKGNGATIVSVLCENNGRVPLKDFGLRFEWDSTFSQWNPARDRLNKKLQKHGWWIETHDRTAIAKQIG